MTRFAMGEEPTVLATSIINLKLTARPTRVAFGSPVKTAGGQHG